MQYSGESKITLDLLVASAKDYGNTLNNRTFN